MRSSLALVLALVTAASASTLQRRGAPLQAAGCPAIALAPPASAGSAAPQLRALRLRGGEGVVSSWKLWAYKTLAKLGIFLKKGKLLVLGLDNAGKSTLLTVLLRDEVVPTAPTHQPVTDEVKVGHLKLRAVDMGGHEIARRMWVQYSHEADGVVYIVDAVDRERFQEAAIELHKLLAAAALPPGAPVLVLGNKCDLPMAAGREELYYGLGLDELAQPGAQGEAARPIGLYMCSIFERRGYTEGFDWMSQYIQ